MRATIDAAGRVVIPKRIREEAGLQAGMSLDVRFRDGRIEIEPAPPSARLVWRGRFLVAVPTAEVEPMGADVVRRTLNALRRERGLIRRSHASRAYADDETAP